MQHSDPKIVEITQSFVDDNIVVAWEDNLIEADDLELFVSKMKVYLDDERVAPDGWLQVRWPDEVIKLLENGEVTHLSLDHDLGDDQHGTGYDVLLWIEQSVALHSFLPPEIMIHTANPAARNRMLAAVEAIRKIWEESMKKS